MEITYIIFINPIFWLVDYMVDINNLLKSRVYKRLQYIISNCIYLIFIVLNILFPIFIIKEYFYNYKDRTFTKKA
jgi:hypothetical protein